MAPVTPPAEPGPRVEHLLPAAGARMEPHRLLLSAPGVRVQRLSLPAGDELPQHATPRRALVQVLAGACDITVGGAAWTLAAGDWMHLPPGLRHAVRARADLVLLVTQVGTDG